LKPALVCQQRHRVELLLEEIPFKPQGGNFKCVLNAIKNNQFYDINSAVGNFFSELFPLLCPDGYQKHIRT